MSAMSLKRLLEWFRDEKRWMVAVHNDYVLDGVRMTFWLFTRGNHFVKGEGVTNEEALERAQRAAVELDERLAVEKKTETEVDLLRRGVLYALSKAMTSDEAVLRDLVAEVVAKIRDKKPLLGDERCEATDSNGIRCEFIGKHDQHGMPRQLKAWQDGVEKGLLPNAFAGKRSV